MLRRKNRLMRSGRLDEANAVTRRVRTAITRQNALMLWECNTRKSTKQTGGESTSYSRPQQYQSLWNRRSKLNNHYAVISTDSNYTEPRVKLTVHDSADLVTEIETFNYTFLTSVHSGHPAPLLRRLLPCFIQCTICWRPTILYML